ncbi:hypothetical protein MN608_06214 [Microdochium nivale]|nr:hypothetical protein MN608_06214 [Microdochium nivale]
MDVHNHAKLPPARHACTSGRSTWYHVVPSAVGGHRVTHHVCHPSSIVIAGDFGPVRGSPVEDGVWFEMPWMVPEQPWNEPDCRGRTSRKVEPSVNEISL